MENIDFEVGDQVYSFEGALFENGDLIQPKLMEIVEIKGEYAKCKYIDKKEPFQTIKYCDVLKDSLKFISKHKLNDNNIFDDDFFKRHEKH